MPIGKAKAIRRKAADVKPRYPRIMTTLVSNALFREPYANTIKTALAIDTLKFTTCINLLVLPAGFLTVHTRAEILPAVRPILKQAKKFGTSIVIGVDLSEIRRYRAVDSGKMLEAYYLGKIPLFLVVYDSATDQIQIFRQRSATTHHAQLGGVPNEVMQPRTIDLCGSTMQIVFCGEVYDSRLFMETAPRMAVIVGHTTMPRLTQTLRAKGRNGFSVIHSEHRAGRDGTLFCNNRGITKNQYGILRVGGDKGLWLEAALWELGKDGIGPSEVWP